VYRKNDKNQKSEFFYNFTKYFEKAMYISRIIYFLFVISPFFFSCNNASHEDGNLPAGVVNNPKSASGTTSYDELPRISFENEVHDFGRVIEGEKITYAFKFSNSGNGDLLITNVKTSCGCTISEYPREPMKSGRKDYIKVTFDSSNRKGFQNKTITVISNTMPGTTTLTIKAQVILPERF